MVLGYAAQTVLNIFRASPLEIFEVIGMVDNAHAVGILIVDLALDLPLLGARQVLVGRRGMMRQCLIPQTVDDNFRLAGTAKKGSQRHRGRSSIRQTIAHQGAAVMEPATAGENHPPREPKF